MKHVQASAAKAHFADLLDQVEAGETVLITRHGKPIARLSPEPDRRREEIEVAVAGIRELRKHTKPWSRDEILAAIKQGRR